VARFADARRLFIAVTALALTLPASGVAQAAESRAMLVATPDPALLSALDAAFSPRGVRVAMADRPLRATGDDPGASARGADLVWLCDVTPAPSATPSSSGTASPATALCVRPQQGQVIIRRIAVATPLSPEDAAALALSVQVALMPGAAPAPETVARPAPLPVAGPTGAAPGGAHSLTLELSAGLRGGPAGRSSRASLSAVYTPGAFEHRFGVGAALGVGSTSLDAGGDLRGPGPPSVPVVEQSRDLTFRLFARGQASAGPIWLQLDIGPAAHATNGVLGEPQGANDNRLLWSMDGFVGAVVPFGPFFAGVRAGGEFAVLGRSSSANQAIGPWSTEALATFGVGWF